MALAKRRVYKTFDGRWCSLYPGANPRREYHNERPKTLRPIQAPPLDADYPQDEFYLGRRGQWRVTAHVEWDWDRQGLHIPAGILIGLLAMTGTAAGIALGCLVAALICLYEVRESGSINDLDWMDLGGIAGGLMATAAGWLIVQHWPALTAAWQWTAKIAHSAF